MLCASWIILRSDSWDVSVLPRIMLDHDPKLLDSVDIERASAISEHVNRR